jgi:hypothetical protein
MKMRVAPHTPPVIQQESFPAGMDPREKVGEIPTLRIHQLISSCIPIPTLEERGISVPGR